MKIYRENTLMMQTISVKRNEVTIKLSKSQSHCKWSVSGACNLNANYSWNIGNGIKSSFLQKIKVNSNKAYDYKKILKQLQLVFRKIYLEVFILKIVIKVMGVLLLYF